MRIIGASKNFKHTFERKFQPLMYQISQLWMNKDGSGAAQEEGKEVFRVPRHPQADAAAPRPDRVQGRPHEGAQPAGGQPRSAPLPGTNALLLGESIEYELTH